MNEWVYKLVSELLNGGIGRERVSKSVTEWLSEWICEWVSKWVNAYIGL